MLDVRSALRRSAGFHAGRTAVISGDVWLTYAQAWTRGIRFANALASLGARPVTGSRCWRTTAWRRPTSSSAARSATSSGCCATAALEPRFEASRVLERHPGRPLACPPFGKISRKLLREPYWTAAESRIGGT
jgi:hypothetical protein